MGGSVLWHPPPLPSRSVCDNQVLSLESCHPGSPRAEPSGALRSVAPGAVFRGHTRDWGQAQPEPGPLVLRAATWQEGLSHLLRTGPLSVGDSVPAQLAGGVWGRSLGIRAHSSSW